MKFKINIVVFTGFMIIGIAACSYSKVVNTPSNTVDETSTVPRNLPGGTSQQFSPNGEQQSNISFDCQSFISPWDINWLPTDQGAISQRINYILAETGLSGFGETILQAALDYQVNPAFALAMFRKEAVFAASGTRAYKNNNPGNIIATGDCRSKPAGSSCNGVYGEISTDGRFGIFPDISAGIQAYFQLLNNEYAPGSKRNCTDLSCVIQSYCPPSDCDTQNYIDQVSAWSNDYQCQISAADTTPSGSSATLPMIENTPIITSNDLISPNASDSTDQIVGLWRGKIKIQGESSSFTYQVAIFQIGTFCQPNNLCLTITKEDGTDFNEDPSYVNIPYSEDNHEWGDYCFDLFLSNGWPLYTGCFTSQADGTLLYKASGGLTSFEGILYKIETPVSSLPDMNSALSISSSINFALHQRDSRIFQSILDSSLNEMLIIMASHPEGPGSTCQDGLGEWCEITDEEFIQEINKRIQSNPTCFYDYESDPNFGNSLSVETRGWNPLWTWPWGEADKMTFLFGNVGTGSGNFKLVYIFLGELPGRTYIPCP